MNEIIAREWIKQLRSGNYTQAIGKLRDNKNNCCCLGVLCDIAPNVKWKRLTSLSNDGRYEAVSNGQSSSTSLTVPVQEWAGMTIKPGTFSTVHELIEANDRGQTFDQIADTIEQTWKDL